MPPAPKVIHQYGRPQMARMPNGDIIERQERIYVPSYHSIYPCLDYDSHFLYYDGKGMGATLRCTCGSVGIIVGFDAYKRFASYQGEKVIACQHYTFYNSHADGSL